MNRHFHIQKCRLIYRGCSCNSSILETCLLGKSDHEPPILPHKAIWRHHVTSVGFFKLVENCAKPFVKNFKGIQDVSSSQQLNCCLIDHWRIRLVGRNRKKDKRFRKHKIFFWNFKCVCAQVYTCASIHTNYLIFLNAKKCNYIAVVMRFLVYWLWVAHFICAQITSKKLVWFFFYFQFCNLSIMIWASSSFGSLTHTSTHHFHTLQPLIKVLHGKLGPRWLLCGLLFFKLCFSETCTNSFSSAGFLRCDWWELNKLFCWSCTKEIDSICLSLSLSQLYWLCNTNSSKTQ